MKQEVAIEVPGVVFSKDTALSDAGGTPKWTCRPDNEHRSIRKKIREGLCRMVGCGMLSTDWLAWS